MWNHKRKERNSFKPKMKKIWHGNILTNFSILVISFLLQYWIDLILAATERGLEDLKFYSLPKLQNLYAVFKAKPNLKVDPLLKKENWHFLFSFLGACVLGFWMLYILKRYKGSHVFGCRKTLFFINFWDFLFSIEVKAPKLG